MVRVAIAPLGKMVAADGETWPTGGGIKVSVLADAATIVLDWQHAGASVGEMLAMPHHEGLLTPDPGWPTLPMATTLAGNLRLVPYAKTTFVLPLVPIAFDAPRAIEPTLASTLAQALATDATTAITATDPHGFGRQVSRKARLVLIADALGDATLAGTLRAEVAAALLPWIQGTNANPLRYDATWGGIVSENGLAAPQNDGGQGYYNDHHVQYGHFLYAAAVVGKGDPAWLKLHAGFFRALARDIANPSATDPHFPRFRHFDWYRGHSWSTGLFPWPESRGTAASAESVFAWEALALLGLTLGDVDLLNVGRVLLSLELRAIARYWQLPDASVYPPVFAVNGVVGRLASLRVDRVPAGCTTLDCAHARQLTSVTPATEWLLGPAFASVASPLLQAAGTLASLDAWRGAAEVVRAVLDPDAAWLATLPLTTMAEGQSKSNLLWWIATRP